MSVPSLAAMPSPLVFRRLRTPAAFGAPPTLGGRWAGAGPGAVHAGLLAPEGSVYDAWCGGASLQGRQHGCVRYMTDGQWLHGIAELDDGPDGVQETTRRAYTDLFEVLGANACPYLLRIWNYLSDINREESGCERYKLFNAGRQQAFIEARRSAFEGAPAASALGTRGGPLQIYFLAGAQPLVAIENPRQVSAYRYPEIYGPSSPSFSRAALADAGGGRDALFISGTASVVGHESLHAGDARRQTVESLLNIAAVLQIAVERSGLPYAMSDLVCTVYVRHAADLETVREVFHEAVGADSPAARDAVYLQADVSRAELLVEIEAHAFLRNGGYP